MINLIKKLPWHSSRNWGKRNRYSINKIIVHQSLSNSTTAGVNNYHIHPNHISSRGLPHIAYHYAIERDGTTQWCNLLTEILAHTRGQNSKAVGIMLNGHFSGEGYDKGIQEPTDKQLKSLRQLLDHLIDFELVDVGLTKKDVYGHHDFGKPACPGVTVSRFLDTYKNTKREIVT